MQPYTLEHSFPPFISYDTYTRSDGAQYFHVQDDILHTHAAVTIDLDEIRSASLYDNIYQHTINQLVNIREKVAATLLAVVSRGLLPYVEEMRARQILEALGARIETQPRFMREDMAEEYSLAAECETYAEYTIKAKLRGNTPLCRADFAQITEYRKVIQQYFSQN